MCQHYHCNHRYHCQFYHFCFLLPPSLPTTYIFLCLSFSLPIHIPLFLSISISPSISNYPSLSPSLILQSLLYVPIFLSISPSASASLSPFPTLSFPLCLLTFNYLCTSLPLILHIHYISPSLLLHLPLAKDIIEDKKSMGYLSNSHEDRKARQEMHRVSDTNRISFQLASHQRERKLRHKSCGFSSIFNSGGSEKETPLSSTRIKWLNCINSRDSRLKGRVVIAAMALWRPLNLLVCRCLSV